MGRISRLKARADPSRDDNGGTTRPQNPGAYAVPGRASGLLPIWVRRREPTSLPTDNNMHVPPELRVAPPPSETPDPSDDGDEASTRPSPESEDETQAENQSTEAEEDNSDDVATVTENAMARSDTGSNGRELLTADVEPAPFEKLAKGGKMSRKRLLMTFLAVVIVIAGVAVGVSMAVGLSSSGDLPPTQAPTEDETLNCDWDNPAVQENPVFQCFCHETLLSLSSNETELYNELKDFIVLPLLPDFNETIDSCAPRNAALTQLTMDAMAGAHATEERYLMTLLYAEWQGPNWESDDDWLSREVALCDWLGMECDASDSVTGLTLESNNLKGTLATELSLLTSLETLVVGANEIEGVLPPELFTMTNLKVLSLSSNFFFGPLSDSIASLSSLEVLYLGFNQLSGSFPTTIGALTNLRELEIWINAFNSQIPTEIGAMKALELFQFHNNYFTGTLPSEMGQLQNLTHLLGQECKTLSGSIPSEFGQLSALETMQFHDCPMDAPLPPEIGGMQSLETLNLRRAGTNGTIPTEIGLLGGLKHLDLGDTNLSGTLPTELSLLTNLETLRLDEVKFSGSVPEEICDLRDGALETFVAICNNTRTPELFCVVPECCSSCTE